MNQGKIYSTPLDAVSDVPDGAVIMLGGFGMPGAAQNLVRGLMEQGARELTCISNTCLAVRDNEYDVANLLENGQVRKVITTFVGNPNQNVPAVEMWRRGKLEIELVPQGVLTERIRAAASGIGGFFLPNAAGTPFEGGREKRVFDGEEQILEEPLFADFAFIAAHQGDTLGNLYYRLTQRNFNPLMAGAATVTIAEVRELVAPGQMDPERVHTPGIYVHRLVEAP